MLEMLAGIGIVIILIALFIMYIVLHISFIFDILKYAAMFGILAIILFLLGAF